MMDIDTSSPPDGVAEIQEISISPEVNTVSEQKYGWELEENLPDFSSQSNVMEIPLGAIKRPHMGLRANGRYYYSIAILQILCVRDIL